MAGCITRSGTTLHNALNIGFDSSGNRVVSVTDAAPWRAALGLSHEYSTSTSNFTPASGYSVGVCRVDTCSGVVTVYIEVTADNGFSQNSWYNIGKIAQGYRPGGYVNARMAVQQAGNDVFMTYRINPSGDVYVYTDVPQSRQSGTIGTFDLPSKVIISETYVIGG